MKVLKKALIAAAALLLVISAAACSGSVRSVKNPTLIQSAKTYEINYETKEWEERSTVEYEYDDNGIVSDLSAEYAVGPTGLATHFVITMEDGHITEAVVQQGGEDENGKIQMDDMRKVEFEYTDIEISPQRYATMMNAHIMDEGNNYYIYNWY